MLIVSVYHGILDIYLHNHMFSREFQMNWSTQTFLSGDGVVCMSVSQVTESNDVEVMRG